MTKQQLFDTIVSGLIKQGRPAIPPHGGHSGYRVKSIDGTIVKDPAGLLIPDDDYREEFEGQYVGWGKGPDVPPVWEYFSFWFPKEQVKMIYELQQLHDAVVSDWVYTNNDWVEMLTNALQRYAEHKELKGENI